MLTTDVLRDAAAMPQCTYSVRQGSADGSAVKYAQIGEPVYHVWVCCCLTECSGHKIAHRNARATHTIFLLRTAMWTTVKATASRCSTTEGVNELRIIQHPNNHRCSIDPVVMGDLTYESGGNARAWVEAHVFKYADRPSLQFQCVVQLCNRGDTECTAITVGVFSLALLSRIHSHQTAREHVAQQDSRSSVMRALRVMKSIYGRMFCACSTSTTRSCSNRTSYVNWRRQLSKATVAFAQTILITLKVLQYL